MPSLLSMAATISLLLPFWGQSSVLLQSQGPDFDHEEPAPQSLAPRAGTPSTLEAFYARQVTHQVRIDQRVIIRITPQRSTNRNSLLAQLPANGLNTRYEERAMERCLPVNRISGVQTGTGNRLLLFLSDQRIVSLNLERACRARDFYSGFYVERSEDGKLCVERDELQSRSGAKCEVTAMRQLVAVND